MTSCIYMCICRNEFFMYVVHLFLLFPFVTQLYRYMYMYIFKGADMHIHVYPIYNVPREKIFRVSRNLFIKFIF